MCKIILSERQRNFKMFCFGFRTEGFGKGGERK